MAPTYTVSRDESHRPAKIAERVLGIGERIGLPFGDLDIPTILADARRRTGLSDWGDDDFLEPMSRLIGDAKQSRITPLARAMLRQGATSAVVNRLRVRDYVARHPEVRDIPIERPVFVLGFPRTGTTLVQNLLTLDAGNRALRLWELLAPAPVHADPARDRLLRRTNATLIVAAAYLVAPEQRVIHEIGVDTAEECWLLFQNRFSALNNDLASGFTGFGDWLLEQDLEPAYREFRLQLQILAHQSPTRRFVLKCPEHLWFLDPLLRVFPDACVVWTHRDPVDSVASYCSLVSLQVRNMWGRVDRPKLGAHISRRFLQGIDRAMAARARHPDAAFFDVTFERLVADPAGIIREIKSRYGMAHQGASEARVAEWLEHGREDGRGKHIYGATRYALDVPALRERFAGYVERFSIPTKARLDPADA